MAAAAAAALEPAHALLDADGEMRAALPPPPPFFPKGEEEGEGGAESRFNRPGVGSHR